jgi:hypothetical protein
VLFFLSFSVFNGREEENTRPKNDAYLVDPASSHMLVLIEIFGTKQFFFLSLLEKKKTSFLRKQHHPIAGNPYCAKQKAQAIAQKKDTFSSQE